MQPRIIVNQDVSTMCMRWEEAKKTKNKKNNQKTE